MTAATIELRDVSKWQALKKKPIPVLKHVDLSVGQSETLCVVGPSGCGKSTLLNLISGIWQPEDGTVFYNGDPVRRINNRVGYITQRDSLLPWRTVRKNVSLGLEIQGRRGKAQQDAVQEAITNVGLAGFESSHPGQLSGGMRKRVQLARTLVCKPETLLLDEPYGALDALTKLRMQQDLIRLKQVYASRLTTVFITHDLTEAVALGDRVVVFSARPAEVVHIEEIDDLGSRDDLVKLQDESTFRRHVDRIWSVLSEQI